MSQTVLLNFLTAVPEAAAIWSALTVLALVLLTVLVARPERDAVTEAEPDPADVEALHRADLTRYADEVAVAAAGAAQTARRRRERWLAAQDEAERAWAAYDEADSAARRLAGTAALPEPHTPRTPSEYAARERWLRHAAMAAHWRGDLTARQLADVLAGRNGWDPCHHPATQEIVLARTVRDGRRAAWETAAERERLAWRDTELAAESARTLAAEAYAAATALRPAPAFRAAPATRVPVPAPVRSARWRPARVG
ncbi:hypothetical protein O7602_18805 [Micromonospora sp. WMMD1128]|uniref:hypothetical protein n=1 Tax=Micromonospora sp. WMMD1128 TaxID=3015150 RepID=UPI00248CFD92|nr:hypothetical protein [Micromonospora sp. WMMD1128]WBB71784.1 hypothetical protein O7602_18805 [Micromonospora sp. WMMD1128]